MTTYSVIGRSVTQQDGPDKVSGSTLYPADIVLPGMLWGKSLRSPYPHAKILRIDTTAAAALPGVRAVVTGKDLPNVLVGRNLRDVPVLAQEKVRFVGERVAAVAADDWETAEEALNLIDVEYEELPSVFNPFDAMEPAAPLVHDVSSSYDSPSGAIKPEGNVISHESWSGGDLEQGF